MPPRPYLAFTACLLIAAFDARAQEQAAPTVEAADPSAAAPAQVKPLRGDAARRADSKDKSAAPPRMIRPPHGSLADLDAAWALWRKALASRNAADLQTARLALSRLKRELGIEVLDAHSVAASRAAAARRGQGDFAQAVTLAETAVELSGRLPSAHWELGRAYFAADASDAGKALLEMWAALRLNLEQPRSLRPLLADLAAAFLLALVGTAGVVVAALFIRRGRYLLHDIHHLFPRLASRWQTTLFALLVLASPWVLEDGLAPMLVGTSVALAIYLSARERMLIAALLALLAPVPLLTGWLARQTAFAGTPAEQLSLVLEGAPGAEAQVRRIAQAAENDRASALELHAAGRLELLRGRPEAAIDLLKRAAALRTGDGAVLTNLGNAMLARDDAEGALALYEEASKAAPALAAPRFNLARVHQRRATTLIEDARPMEIAKASSALVEAVRLDPSLAGQSAPTGDEVTLLDLVLVPTVDRAELLALAVDEERAERVTAQVARNLLGNLGARYPVQFPLAASALVLLIGWLGSVLRPSHPCERCGRPVCRRCDPELGVVSQMCHQCVNVFARRGVVPAPLKVKKQIEAAQYKTREERLGYGMGALCAGGGHLYSGAPLRGAAYVLVFLFGIALAGLRNGLLRSACGELPGALRWVPALLLVLGAYALSLRALYKRQST